MADDKVKPNVAPATEGRDISRPEPSSYEQRGYNMPTPQPQPQPQQTNNNSGNSSNNSSSKE